MSMVFTTYLKYVSFRLMTPATGTQEKGEYTSRYLDYKIPSEP